MADFKTCTHCERTLRRDEFRSQNHICNGCIQEGGQTNIAKQLSESEQQMIADFKAKQLKAG